MSTPVQRANLARIRDNQRRSRARRREYLQELEQRLRVYELQGVEASSEVQQAARRVAEENRQLRGLLNRQGITNDYISTYLRSSGAEAQTDPTPISHSPLSNLSDAVQSLQQVIAPRRPAPLDSGVSYIVPPQESRETPIASASMTDDSLWGGPLQPAPQLSPASDQPLPRQITSSTQPVPSHMHQQEQYYPAGLVTQAQLFETYGSGAAFGRPPDHSPLLSGEVCKMWMQSCDSLASRC